MKPIDFIQDWVIRNKELLPIDSAKYEFHPYSETHFLKVTPESIIENEEYEEILSNLIISFDNEFPDEGLCLINDKSLTTLENPVELIPIVVPSIASVAFDFNVSQVFIPTVHQYFDFPNSANRVGLVSGNLFGESFRFGFSNIKYTESFPIFSPLSENKPEYFPEHSEKFVFTEKEPYNIAA